MLGLVDRVAVAAHVHAPVAPGFAHFLLGLAREGAGIRLVAPLRILDEELDEGLVDERKDHLAGLFLRLRLHGAPLLVVLRESLDLISK